MTHDTEQFLSFLFGTGPIIELRARCADDRWRHGLYTDWSAMSRHAHALQSRYGIRGLYYSLNPVTRDLVTVPAALNTFTPMHKFSRCVSNNHIAGRLVYLIDIDSTHPKESMASDQEHDRVCPVRDRIVSYLSARGWPEPVTVDSGNGCHILYRGDGCDPSSPFWAHCLGFLSKEFSTADAKIDEAVWNAGRIARLPGCMNRKGEDTSDRPHRMAKVLSYPPSWVPVTESLVRDLAIEQGCDPEPRKRSRSSIRVENEDIQEFFDEFSDDLDLVNTREKNGLACYDIVCPFNGPHTGDPGKTSIIVGADGMGFHCMSDDCVGLTFRDLLDRLRENNPNSPDPWDVLFAMKERDAQKFGCTLEEMDMLPIAAPATIDAPKVIDHEFETGPEPESTSPIALTPEEFDRETMKLLTETDWSAVPTDSHVWRVPTDETFEAWLRLHMHDDTEYQPGDDSIGAAIGADELFRIARARARPGYIEMPPRVLTVAEMARAGR